MHSNQGHIMYMIQKHQIIIPQLYKLATHFIQEIQHNVSQMNQYLQTPVLLQEDLNACLTEHINKNRMSVSPCALYVFTHKSNKASSMYDSNAHIIV